MGCVFLYSRAFVLQTDLQINVALSMAKSFSRVKSIRSWDHCKHIFKANYTTWKSWSLTLMEERGRKIQFNENLKTTEEIN